MVLLLTTFAQAATVVVSVHDGSPDLESRVVTTVHDRTDAPIAWTTALGRERQMLVEVNDTGGQAFVTVRVRERGDDGWALVSQPTLRVDRGEPARFVMGALHPVATEKAQAARGGGRRTQGSHKQDVTLLDLRIELLEAATAPALDGLYISAFQEPLADHAITWANLPGELTCPAELQVEVKDGATSVRVPLTVQPATWSCTLRQPDGSDQTMPVHLRVW